VAKFPTIYRATVALSSFSAGSIFQESVNSVADATLTTRRMRHVDSPELLEALVVLRYLYSMERKENKEQIKLAKKEEKTTQSVLKSSVSKPLTAEQQSHVIELE
jgi:hypothetical protein